MAKKEAKAKKENKSKKSFFKDFKAELTRVSWPTPKQLVNNTIAVITIVFITAAIVFVLDLAFEYVNKYGVEQIKKVITTNETENSITKESTDASNQEENVEANTQDNAEINEENSAE